MDDPNLTPRVPDPTYQDRDLRLSIVMGVVLVSLGVTFLTFIGMSRMFSAYRNQFSARARQVSPLATERVLPPATVLLQVNEAADLAAYRASEDAVKNQYAWIDAQAGTVRIPVRRAMERVAELGLPVAPEFLAVSAAE